MTRPRVVVPGQVSLGFAAAAVFLLAMGWTGDTGPWPDGVTTTGRVVHVQNPWSPTSGSARVTYRVAGADIEHWLPDATEHGPVEVGDPYLLEYRADDPTEARRVFANRDDAESGPRTTWAGVAAAVLAVAAALAHRLWRERPTSSDGPEPRRSC